MESQDKEEEYGHSVWEIYRKEWATASSEKKAELNKRMNRWQELMKSGLPASQAYIQVVGEESDESPVDIAIEEESDYRVAEEPSDKSPSYSFLSWIRKARFVILAIALVAALVYCVVITGQKSTLNAELESVQSELASTEAKLSSAKQTLTSTQAELDSTKQTLASKQEDLASAQKELFDTNRTLTFTKIELDEDKAELGAKKTELVATQADLASAQEDLATTQSELGSTKQSLASTQQQLTVAQETLAGLRITLHTSKECYDVALIDNPTATNPTWSQLMAFLSQDQTEKNTYIKDVYDCSQFSRDVHNNAEAAGIRAAEVQVKFRNEEVGHALNAFLTTDYGLVYVDCTRGPDTIARVKTGKEYRAVELYKITRTNVRNDYWWDTLSSYYYFPSSFLTNMRRYAVTSSIKIYW